MAISQRIKSLQARGNELSDTFYQLDVLNGITGTGPSVPKFTDTLNKYGPQYPVPLEVLQVNVGKLCNQSCAHCHVDAGPDRREVMSKENMEICLDILKKHNIPTIDITGGAPELNTHFRWFAEECRNLDRHVIDRCNLTIIVSHPKYHDLPEFFATHQVHVIASLPYFTRLRTDNQRGDGVFDDSIKALKMLNAVGYGKEKSGLVLDLVYNPSGAFLPSDQDQLEAEFKRQLDRRYGIRFNHLYAIANLPISRFLDYLIQSNNYEQYMTTLVEAFNPSTIEGLMCRNTLSVGWDGYLYDCDFNQMLDLKVDIEDNHISRFNVEKLMQRRIMMNQHCYGCTAGAGSGCGGAIAL